MWVQSELIKWCMVVLFLVGGMTIGLGQCPIPNFSIPDTVCPNSVITPVNTTDTGYTYAWDACTGDLLQTPSLVNLGQFQSSVADPRSISLVNDGNEWYGFVKNLFSGGPLIRLNFGSDLSNTPTDTSFIISNLLQVSFGQIKFRKEAGLWYGLTATATGNKLVRLEFGNSLNNVPVAVDLGNLGGLLTNPGDVRIRQWGDTIFTVIPNYNNNMVTVVEQIGSILAPFNAIYNFSLASVGIVNGATNLELIRDSCGWVGFSGLQFNSRLVRMDFGSSLSNTPTVTNLVNVFGSVVTPVALVAAHDRGNYFLFIRNRASGIVRIDFGDSFRNAPTSGTNFGNFGGTLTGNNDWLAYGQDGSRHYLFTGNSSFELLRLDFPDPCQNTPAVDTGQAPDFTIVDAGQSVLTLTVLDSNGNSWYRTDTLVQTAAPVAQFSQSNLCASQNTSFVDGSIPGSGNLNAWKWHFGDGDSSSFPSPGHVYLNPGNHPVTLEIGNSFGCKDTASKTLNLQFSPTAAFTSSPACEGDTLPLQNNSSIGFGAISSYTWIDQDGLSTSGNLPDLTYDTAGTLPLKLIVESDSGCIDSVANFINSLARPVAQFSVEKGCEGDTTQLVNLSTLHGSSSFSGFSWDLGDFTSSTAVSPQHLYPDTGNYLVTMVASAVNGCADSIAEVIRIANRPIPFYSYGPLIICQGDSVQFTDLTIASADTVTGWLWDFGTIDSSTQQNPTYAWAVDGLFAVNLTATVGSGCDSTTTQLIEVRPLPVPQFSISERCLNAGTLFSDGSTVAAGDSIVDWAWDFGDNQTDTVPSPIHPYLQSGDFSVQLEVTTALGCSAIDTVPTYIFGLPIVAFSNSFSCSGLPTNFFEQAQADSGDPLASWKWTFDNLVNMTSDSAFGPIASVVFDTGVVHVVTLSVTSNQGCVNSNQTTLAVNQSPKADFDFIQACDGNPTQFINESSGGSLNYIWDFSTGLNSTLVEPAFLFDSSGSFQVTLVARDIGSTCTDTISLPVAVFPSPVAVIPSSTPQNACLGIPVEFTDSSYVFGDTITDWTWTVFGGDTAIGPTATFTFTDTALQLVSLLVTSSDGCLDSTSQTLNVRTIPSADFSFTPEFGVPPLDVTFTNQSIGGSSYQWTYGDGNSSNQTAPVYQYTSTGIYTIQLQAFNNFGCVDSSSRIIKVIQPLLDIAVTDLEAEIQGGFYSLRATLSNLGTREITDLELLVEPAENSRIRETWSGNLASGAQINYTFAASFAVVDESRPVFTCVTAQNPNGESDDVPENNQDCLLEVSELTLVVPFPNPAIDQISLSLFLPGREEVEVYVYDNIGQLKTILFKGTLPEGRSDLDLSLLAYSSGIYHFTVIYRDQVEVLPFVKAD